jgi:hypothetical protein
MDGSRFDTRALGGIAERNGPAARGLRSHLTVVLDGALILRRDHERDLGERELVGESDTAWDERWEGRRFACVVWEWDATVAPLLERPSDARLTHSDICRVQRVFDALMMGARGPAAAALAVDAGALAQCFGIDLPNWNERSLGPTPPGAQALGDLLSDAFCSLDEKPMWTDLEGGAERSERQLRRRLKLLGDWVDVPGGAYRERLRLLRACGAATLLGAAGVSVEHVARSVGYGSARALALALREQGLGTHEQIRAVIRSGDRLERNLARSAAPR